MKRLVILNPASRHGTGGTRFAGQRADWERKLGPFELHPTRGPGDAADVVRRALREGKFDQILVAGGDGTLNEAFSGYWEAGRVTDTKVPLGIINLGTGGDFFRTVRVYCPDYDSALADNRFRLVDAATVSSPGGGEPRPFLNVASAGMAAAMLRRLKGSRFQAGAAAYFFHTFATFLRDRPRHVTVDYLDESGENGHLETDLVNLFVCNGRCSGGGMVWAPGARLDDGLLRLTLITGKRKWPLIRHSGKIYRGDIAGFPGARIFAVRRVTVRCEDALGIEADGEIVERPPAPGTVGHFEVHPGVFPLVI